MTHDRFASLTFHALAFDRSTEWDRVKEHLLRYLNSVEGQRQVARSREPVVVLGSRPVRARPRYLHLTDAALEMLRKLGIPFDIFTSAFYEELPSNQVIYFDSTA